MDLLSHRWFAWPQGRHVRPGINRSPEELGDPIRTARGVPFSCPGCGRPSHTTVAASQERGIDVKEFGEKLTSSGIVLNDEIVWIAFHAGYDFGYLLKLLTLEPMPEKEGEFYELLGLSLIHI